MMRVFYMYQKGMSVDEGMSNSEEIKPVALSIVELYLVGGMGDCFGAGRSAGIGEGVAWPSPFTSE